ncbi:hypothetical protein NEOLEDRAFT_1131807 [Neolentinus lepideus HHB14362 ss-1]|uniref:Uncharacterized protein n=1 Tax=Neolentinus lepideus HHB14362 ss-1 TaxID=1314782 RepID=A0A165TJT6_9AGAM|nr:hypothetical protein NEOLEDRAFT_1131807 [Neolentinus lepideus HHB14362 ss-1]
MTDSLDLAIVESAIIFSQKLEVTSPGNLSGSPVVWDSTNGGHVGSLTFLGPGVLHIIQPSDDLEDYALRSFRVPEVLASYPAVGRRCGLSAQIEWGRGLVFWTVQHPEVVGLTEDEGAQFAVATKCVPLGHFVVDEINHLAPIATRIDEWTGRACLILEDGPDHRSLSILDVI